MRISNRKHVTKNNILPAMGWLMAGVVAFALFLPAHRQYSPGSIPGISQEDKEDDAGALEMAKYFFNIRKDNHTNTMNYPAMLAADIADRNMSRAHSAVANGLTTFNWTSLGPTNIGGRTRAILIDNQDPTHQTIFAGGVSGGIWKSTNGGSTWGSPIATLAYSLNDNLSNMQVCDISQSADGTIYIGTGEGFSLYDEGEMFSVGMLGGGIFQSKDDGVTWTLLTATEPTSSNNDGVAWAYTNRIACQPNNNAVIYAVHNEGLEISTDTGNTWAYCVKSTGGDLTGNALDLKISPDGKVIVACVAGIGYYCYPSSSDNWQDKTFTAINSNKNEGIPHGFYIEFAISPTNPNYIYASEIASSETFNSSSSGIYFTENSETNGGHWYLIGPGGSQSFEPYLSAGDQSVYDNTIGVDPTNPGRIILGGVPLFNWIQSSPSDTQGEWSALPSTSSIHVDQHAVVFDPNIPGVVYFGNDGGVYKSYDGGNTAAAFNRNYDVTQYYAIAYSPAVNLSNQEGVGGGTQDNGSPFMVGSSPSNPNDATEILGGDGGQSVISQLNPNVAFATSDYGSLGRTGGFESYGTPSNLYTANKGDSIGGNIDSVYELESACFVMPLALYENSYDLNNLDSMIYVADSNYSIGQTIYPVSPNGSVSFPYVLTRPVLKGDSVTVPNRVVSKLAVAFTPANGVWVTGQAIDLTDLTVWIPIGGPYSTPDACSTGSSIHCLAWSPDGDDLWAGTEDGYLYRFTNMNSIIANKYISGCLWYENGSGIVKTGNQVVCTAINISGVPTERDIISIAVDPQNSNNVMVTLGNYGYADYVYFSSTALAASPTWASAQGNLPAMPVYGSILDIFNGTGNHAWATGSAMIATEHGMYTTANINAASPSWVKNNSGMANVLTAGVKQQTLEPWECNNSGDIYVGTHGRGIYYSGSANIPTAVQPVANVSPSIGLTVYPNPMITQGTLKYTLNTSQELWLEVYDIQGKVVESQNLGTQMAGNHLIPLQVSAFKAGTYFVSLQANNTRQVAKFVVVQ